MDDMKKRAMELNYTRKGILIIMLDHGRVDTVTELTEEEVETKLKKAKSDGGMFKILSLPPEDKEREGSRADILALFPSKICGYNYKFMYDHTPILVARPNIVRPS